MAPLRDTSGTHPVAADAATPPVDLQQLVVARWARLVEFFRRRGHGAEAEDLVQEVACRVARTQEVLEPPRPDAWLTTVAMNVSRDARRAARRRHRLVPLDDEGRIEPGRADDRSNANARREVERLMGALSKHERQAVLLRYVMGLSTPEIGTALGISYYAAKARLGRAMARLRLARKEQR